ncbi:uncharacterized protein METZ01_LOCUS218556 [marine metagenome]|uniref:Uncharacterized protein n=1 Tax=marine metagenome TaxID=408172 RepID=A0A382FSW8_9ZZZZ
MDIFENETRFDPLIELNHPLHKEKRSQLSRAWLNQESVNRGRSSLWIESCLLCKTSHYPYLKKEIITIFSGCNGIVPIAQVFYFFNIMGFARIGESIKVDYQIIRMAT